jgi:hypothetical protein
VLSIYGVGGNLPVKPAELQTTVQVSIITRKRDSLKLNAALGCSEEGISACNITTNK